MMAQPYIKKLKTICIALIQDASISNMQLLEAGLAEVDADGIQHLDEYLLFPLRLAFKDWQQRSLDYKIALIHCMNVVCGRVVISRKELFVDLFNNLCISISDIKKPGAVVDIAEEYKLAFVDCLSALFRSLSNDLLTSVYSAEFLPALSHAVTLLLNMAEHECSRQLRTKSMICLKEAAQLNRQSAVSDHQRDAIGTTFASFLPGIAMTLCRIANGDRKQGYAVTCAAIEVWQSIVCLVVGDACLEKSHTGKSDVIIDRSKPAASDSGRSYGDLLVSRSSDWVKVTGERLQLLTQRMKSLASHSNWRVRLAVAQWAQALLNKCRRSLPGSVPHCLEVLVSLMYDEYANIASTCQAALRQYQESSSRDAIESKSFVEILEENIHNICTYLPRIMRNIDESEKLHHVRMLTGYVTLMTPHIKMLLASQAHLNRLSRSLLDVLEMDCSSVAIVQDRTAGALAVEPRYDIDASSTSHPGCRKQFVHFRDPYIFKELQKLLRLLGQHGNVDLLVDHFLDSFYQSAVNRKQAILVINEICRGLIKDAGEVSCDTLPTESNTSDGVQSLIRSLLSVYLSPEHFDLPVTNQVCASDIDALSLGQLPPPPSWQVLPTGRQPSCNLRQLNSNILQTCLLLEGVAVFAQVSGSDFNLLLMDVLYPVLEKVGSNNAAIHQTALMALQSIADTCSNGSITELISTNADYLVSAISLRMRHLWRHPRAPLVLCVILRFSDQSILPLMEDTILEILTSLDLFYEDVGLPFMNILLAICKFIKKWFAADVVVDSSNDNKFDAKHTQTPDDVISFMTDYIKTKKIADGQFNDSGYNDLDEGQKQEESMENTDDNINTEAEQPYHIQKISQILDRCIHLLGAGDMEVRLKTLDTVAEGLQALRSHENVLLPFVHKLWAPLLPRLADQEMLVILKACNVLNVFASVSKDFIRRRVITDVFPRLTRFLVKQQKTSLKAGPVYHHSLGCKLQQTILNHVGKMCALIGAGESQLTPVLHACKPYLSCRQPVVLQQACLATFKEFIKLEPDTVWLFCVTISCAKAIKPPHERFHPVKILANDKPNEFSGNIKILLQQL